MKPTQLEDYSADRVTSGLDPLSTTIESQNLPLNTSKERRIRRRLDFVLLTTPEEYQEIVAWAEAAQKFETFAASIPDPGTSLLATCSVPRKK